MLLLLALILFLLAGMVTPVRLKVYSRYTGKGLRTELTARVFFMLIPIKFIFITTLTQAGVLIFKLGRKNKCTRIKQKKVKKSQIKAKEWLQVIPRAIGFKCFTGRIVVGWTYDAALLALSCGFLESLFDTVARTLFPPKIAEQIKLYVKPDFDADWFRLELEGIFHIRTANIITAVVKRYISLRGAKKHDASYRKHHEEFYGTN